MTALGAIIGGSVAAAVVLGSVILHFMIAPRRLQLSGKLVVITGGSLGIGKALAKEAIQKGATVLLVARTASKLKEAAEELKPLAKGEGQKVLWAAVDVGAGYKEIEAGLSAAIKAAGAPVEVLINCAGTSIAGAFEDLPIEAFEKMMRVNYLGSVYPTRVVLPSMKERRSGAIVFVSSQAGQVGLWGYSSYSASKFALRGMAQALQMEVQPYNIHVSVAYPPDTDTPGFKVENESKPSETAAICAAGAVFHPTHVAQDILRGVEYGQFSVATGLDGFMLANLTCGMEPVFSVLQAASQVLTCSLFRLVSLFYVMSFDSISKGYADKKEPSKRQTATTNGGAGGEKHD